jgi:hypothetical protein
MPAPDVPIDVDAETGHWITDGVPMIYTPRAFFVNIQRAVEDAIGAEGYRQQLYRAAYEATHGWCGTQAALHQISGPAIFHHYLDRLSKRGWGRFSLVEANCEAGTARARLDHSTIAAGFGAADRSVCYMFDGAFAAAMDWVGNSMGHRYRTTCTEAQCAAEKGQEHCVFEVRPMQA